MDNPQFSSKGYPGNSSGFSEQEPSRYDARIVQAACSRQMTSLQGPRRFVPQSASNNAPEFKALKNQVAATFAPAQNQGQYLGDDDSSEYGGNARYYDSEDRKNDMSGSDPRGVGQSDRPTGLRHFSTKVCEKVKQKGLTNYNEVADELVHEYFEQNSMNQDVVKQEYDMKNIRRRVYDALNVLLAMNIITKNKKDIRWVGLPASSAQEIARLEEDKQRREQSIKGKLETLQEMIVQLVTYKNLVAKNREEERTHGRPSQQSLLHLPFLIVNTSKDANVDCSVSSDKAEYLFSFDKPFEIQDDLEVLKKMDLSCGLDTGNATQEQTELAKSYLPPLIRPYIDDILSGHKRVREERAEEERKAAEQEKNYYDRLSNDAELQQMNYEQSDQHELAEDGREGMMDIIDEVSSTSSLGVSKLMENPRQVNSPVVRVLQTTSGQSIHRIPRPVSVSMASQNQVQSTSDGGGAMKPRYFIQNKLPPGAIVRREGPVVRAPTRPYPAPQGARVVNQGGPVRYYVAAGAGNNAPGPTYKSVAMQKIGVRPIPPQSGGPRHVYQPQMVQNRVIQQRFPGPQPGTTIVRKVLRKTLPPKDSGQMSHIQHQPHQQLLQQHHQQQPHHQLMQQQQQQQNQQFQQHHQIQQQHHSQMMMKKNDSAVDSHQNIHKNDMPMSSRQSDMLQQQQQEAQFDPYYDPIVTDEHIDFS